MKRYFVWALAIVNLLIGVARLIGMLKGAVNTDFSIAEGVGFLIIIATFSVLGAIIILQAAGNRVGWLMLLLGFVLADPFATYLGFTGTTLQTQNSFLFYFAFWTQGWFYFVIIYAIFLIILHFPDGRPPGPRWKIINLVSLSTLGIFVLTYTFQPKFGDSTLLIDNPIAILPVSADETLAGLIFGLGLILLALGSVISIFVRFRRAGAVERSQIKWLLFSGALSFAGIGYRMATYEPGVSDWTSYILSIAMVSVGVSISIAILRYRLYDIDIIIRRTLQYAIVTSILALIYFGGIVILQGILGILTGSANSPIVTVITTLVIAALFNPLRIRVQDFIDQRFYRAKYDAQQTLAQFAATARDEVDMDRLAMTLIDVVSETIQPEHMSLWVKPMDGRKEK